jgi:NADPH2:quinone reductase
MRAVVMTAAGGPEVLQLTDRPEPQITGPHDVRVRLRAAGVNPVDAKLRSGGLLGGSLPAVLGWDGAGVVAARAASATCPCRSRGWPGRAWPRR